MRSNFFENVHQSCLVTFSLYGFFHLASMARFRSIHLPDLALVLLVWLVGAISIIALGHPNDIRILATAPIDTLFFGLALWCQNKPAAFSW